MKNSIVMVLLTSLTPFLAFGGGSSGFVSDTDATVTCRGDVAQLTFHVRKSEYKGDFPELTLKNEGHLSIVDDALIDQMIENGVIRVQQYSRRSKGKGSISAKPHQENKRRLSTYFRVRREIGFGNGLFGETSDELYQSKLVAHEDSSDLPILDVRQGGMKRQQFLLKQINPRLYEFQILELTGGTQRCVASRTIPNPWFDPGQEDGKETIEVCDRAVQETEQTAEVAFYTEIHIDSCTLNQ